MSIFQLIPGDNFILESELTLLFVQKFYFGPPIKTVYLLSLILAPETFNLKSTPAPWR